jgi:hypothetical protein
LGYFSIDARAIKRIAPLKSRIFDKVPTPEGAGRRNLPKIPFFRHFPSALNDHPVRVADSWSGDKKSASQSGSWALSCLPGSGSMIPPGPLQWWPQEIQMEKDDAIDSQIKRLEDYLLGNKQIVNAHEITIEQALALAYIARELRGRKA